MASREELLELLWTEVINKPLTPTWIDHVVAAVPKESTEPFSEVGLVLKRLLAAGATRQDLARLARFVSYEAVYQTLYMLDDPGIEDDNHEVLYEELLGADPSDLEGKPG